MILSSEHILDVAIQLCSQIKPPFQISSIEMEEDEWVLVSDDTLKCLERDNVVLFIRMLLQANSRIIPRDLPSEVLMAHLCMLAPKLPIDLVPIIEAGLNGRIDTIDGLSTHQRPFTTIPYMRSIRAINCKYLTVNISHIGQSICIL